jgi:hypothetical protein
MPEHVPGFEACLSERLGNRVEAIDLGKEGVGHSRLQRARLDKELECVFVVGRGDAGSLGGRSELEKQVVRISSGALIPVDDHER